MSFTLAFTDGYTRRAARFIKKHPEIKTQYGKTLELLECNPYTPSLRFMRYGAGYRECTAFRST